MYVKIITVSHFTESGWLLGKYNQLQYPHQMARDGTPIQKCFSDWLAKENQKLEKIGCEYKVKNAEVLFKKEILSNVPRSQYGQCDNSYNDTVLEEPEKVRYAIQPLHLGDLNKGTLV